MVDLDIFIGNAKFAKFAFCAFSRPKYLYQVGFYRIVGPLVFIWNVSIVRNMNIVYGKMQCIS